MQWIGSREVAFILANASDLPAPPADWLAKARTKIFHDPVDGADLSSYITAVSHNKASLTGDIFGPYTTNAKRPDGSCDVGEATGRIINAAPGSRRRAWHRVLLCDLHRSSSGRPLGHFTHPQGELLRGHD